ncbi:hypothetical protein UPYG_G00257300 [Umbra pygmaea]|uniref:Uncharacterized protein n=1 Tax=Umbra pygmaea TaxID=75934 RepID=A0ABD0W8M6_UMBPY
MKPKSLVSRLFNNDTSCDRQSERGTGYNRHVDRLDLEKDRASRDTPNLDGKRIREKYAREISFVFLTEKYEPLAEDDDEGRQRVKEDKKNKNKRKYKKVKKNFGKALRYSWKCLMLGLHSMAASYATPLTTVATLVPEFNVERDRR